MKQKEENQATHMSLPCLNWKRSILINLGRCGQNMRRIISLWWASGRPWGIPPPLREGFNNLSFIKLWGFAYLLCPAVTIAVCETREVRDGWQLLSPAVCTGKPNRNPAYAAAVVGGSGSKDIAGGKSQLRIQKKKQLGFGSNRWEQDSEEYSQDFWGGRN